MRAGVRFDDERCWTVVVDARGAVVAAHVESSDGDTGIREALGWLARHVGDELASVTFDVSRMLRLEPRACVTALRIGPRPAADAIHELTVAPELAGSVTRAVHVAGGHDMRGRPLTDLDVASLRAELAAMEAPADFIASVAAVGSIANPEHEERAADTILAAFPDARISLSHEFFSSALRDRDFTATANAAYVRSGEQLAAAMEAAGTELLPGAAIAFGLNDGGRAPIRRLTATPVHAVRATAALRVQGARHLAGIDDGDIVIADADRTVVAPVHSGMPATNSLVDRGREPSLASNAARVEDYAPTSLSDVIEPAAVVDAREAGVDLGALGAAVAPLSSWADHLGHATSAAGLQAVLRAAEELRSQTIYWGAGPGSTRVVESDAYTLAYGSRNVVRIRVHVIGDPVPVPAQEPVA